MATLPSEERFAVWAEAMALLSRHNIEAPVTKPELRWLVNYLDDNLETFEADVVDGIPAGDGKDWLVSNPSIARRLIVMIAERRREVL
jgi:hypothetical protein